MKKLLVAFTLLLSVTWQPTPVVATRATGSCPKYESLLVTFAPKGGWDVRRMSGYMYRESRCNAKALSKTADSGLLQINQINLPYLSKLLHTKVTRAMLTHPGLNIWASARLCEYAVKAWKNCYQPWKPQPK